MLRNLAFATVVGLISFSQVGSAADASWVAVTTVEKGYDDNARRTSLLQRRGLIGELFNESHTPVI